MSFGEHEIQEPFTVSVNWSVVRLGIGRLTIEPGKASLRWIGGQSVLTRDVAVGRGQIEWYPKPKYFRVMSWPLRRGRILLSPMPFTDRDLIGALRHAGFSIIERDV